MGVVLTGFNSNQEKEQKGKPLREELESFIDVVRKSGLSARLGLGSCIE